MLAQDSSTGGGLNFQEALKHQVSVSILSALFICVAVWLLQKWPERFNIAPD